MALRTTQRCVTAALHRIGGHRALRTTRTTTWRSQCNGMEAPRTPSCCSSRTLASSPNRLLGTSTERVREHYHQKGGGGGQATFMEPPRPHDCAFALSLQLQRHPQRHIRLHVRLERSKVPLSSKRNRAPTQKARHRGGWGHVCVAAAPRTLIKCSFWARNLGTIVINSSSACTAIDGQ